MSRGLTGEGGGGSGEREREREREREWWVGGAEKERESIMHVIVSLIYVLGFLHNYLR